MNLTHDPVSAAPVQRRQPVRLISGVIILILGLQTLAVVLATDKSFPFQHYPMYAEHHEEGEHVEVELTPYALLADGRTLRVTAEDLDMKFFVFRRQFVKAILEGDVEKAASLIVPYEKARGVRVQRLRVDNYPVIVTRDGPREAPVETIAAIDLRPAAAIGDAR